MKKLFILAAFVVMPAIVAGCSCVQPAAVQPVCPVVESACPPVVAQVVKPVAQPVAVVQPVVQQSCPPAAQPVAQPIAVKPFTVYPVAPAPLPVGGQITYAQPIQVSGVNGVVQYYNPYLQTVPAQ